MSPNPDRHPEDVKAAIRKTGVTLTDLSVRWGYQPDSVRAALRRPWPTVEALIAKHLHRQPWMIWPSRYDVQHKPLKRRYGRQTRGRAETFSNDNAGA